MNNINKLLVLILSLNLIWLIQNNFPILMVILFIIFIGIKLWHEKGE
jgi:hypothetical protein